MILPTKNLNADRSILKVSGDILYLLNEPKTVSHLWTEFKKKRNEKQSFPYDWFILALDFLYILCAVDYDRGKIRRKIL